MHAAVDDSPVHAICMWFCRALPRPMHELRMRMQETGMLLVFVYLLLVLNTVTEGFGGGCITYGLGRPAGWKLSITPSAVEGQPLGGVVLCGRLQEQVVDDSACTARQPA